ncbi:MAG TPA: hypothetical protein VEA99_17625 [Gemmatimonadaceae bacterium]|nr:hypothetical protein [Gemmatimonadaceae bacterium]
MLGVSGWGPVFLEFDLTVTPAGGAALRRLARSPLVDATAIRARQATLQYLASRLSSLPLRDLAATADGAARYLGSSYVALPEGWLRAWLSVRGDQTVAGPLLDGIRALRALLGHVGVLVEALHEAPPTAAELIAIRSTLEAGLALPAVRRLRASGPAAHTKLAMLDRALREVEREWLQATLAALAELDALAALARIGARTGYAYPEILDDGARACFVELRHPLLPAGVPNSIAFDGEHRVVYLTGPNMSGKTTFLRSCALAIYLAQLGAAVPATRAQVGAFERIVSAIEVSDDIQSGVSLYLAEVRRIRALLRIVASGQRTFAVMDEMFKGTNIADAQDATCAVVLALARASRGTFLVSSHLTEVASYLADTSSIALRHFVVVETEQGPRGDFRLREGVSTQRFGMRLLEAEGVLALLDVIA